MKIIKKTISLILAVCLIASVFAVVAVSVSANNGDEIQNTDTYSAVTANPYSITGSNDNATILQCWNWSYANLEKKIPKIAQQGFSVVQISPPNEIKEGTVDHKVTGEQTNGWWMFYQPAGFQINESTDNALGTKADLVKMVKTAHSYGVRVIADSVINHMGTANDEETNSSKKNSTDPMVHLTPAAAKFEPEIYNNELFHSPWFNMTYAYEWDGPEDKCTKDLTRGCTSRLPDLKTEDPIVQDVIYDYLQELVDCGIDGFRFDAAKHIETPYDLDGYCSDFWENTVTKVRNYALTTYSKDLLSYGEILNTCGYNRKYDYYFPYMKVTDSYIIGKVQSAVINNKVSEAIPQSMKNGTKAQTVLWNESHDTYMNDPNGWGSTRNFSKLQRNKAWAAIAARDGITSMYFARPSSLTQDLGVASDTDWTSKEVAAVNRFNNFFAGQGEYLDNSGSIAVVGRGNSSIKGGGAVLVNCSGTSKSASGVPVATMSNGTYKDLISGAGFVVSDGKITSGQIGSTGIAVLYPESLEPDPTGNTDPTAELTTATDKTTTGDYNSFTPTTVHSDLSGKDEYKFWITNNKGWGAVKVFAYNDSGDVTSAWPGWEMTEKVQNGFGEQVVAIYIPTDATGCVINDGGTNQTEIITDFRKNYWITDATTTGEFGQTMYKVAAWDDTPITTEPSTDSTEPTTAENTTYTEPVTEPETDPTGNPDPVEGYNTVYLNPGEVSGDWSVWSFSGGESGQFISGTPADNDLIKFEGVSDNCIFVNTSDGGWSGRIGQTDTQYVSDGGVFVLDGGESECDDGYGNPIVLYSGDWGESVDNPTDPIDEHTDPVDETTVPVIETRVPVEETTEATEATTAAPATESNEGHLTAVFKLNGAEIKKQDVTGDTLKVTYNITAPEKLVDGQAALTYNKDKLTLEKWEFPIVGNTIVQRITDGLFNFNSSKKPYDFTNGGILVVCYFKIKNNALGVASINLMVEELDSADTVYVAGSQITAKGQFVINSMKNSVVVEDDRVPTESTTVVNTEPTTYYSPSGTTVEPTEKTTVDSTEVTTVKPTERITVEPTEYTSVLPTEVTTAEPATVVPTYPEVNPSENKIYFDASEWSSYSIIYCHIWERGGDSFFPWQSKKEACKKVDGNIYVYDLSILDYSTTIEGGLRSGTDYCIIFSANTGVYTYDATFDKACVGDTIKVTGNKIENIIDSTKKNFEAVWTTNSSAYGPHLAISSIGNINGSKLCPNETGEEVIGDWISTYYKSPNVDAVDALTKAYPILNITSSDQISTIFGYVQSKNTGEDENAILRCLTEAFAKAYPAKPDEVKDNTSSTDVTENTNKTEPLTTAPETIQEKEISISFLPSKEQLYDGDKIKLVVRDTKGEYYSFDMSPTPMICDGVPVYSVKYPAEIVPVSVQFQVFSGDTWKSQVSITGEQFENLQNEIITFEGKAYVEQQSTDPIATEPQSDNPTEPVNVVTDPTEAPSNIVQPTQPQKVTPTPSTKTVKKANPVKITVKKKTVKAKKLKGKKQTVKAISIKNAKGTIKFSIVKKGTTLNLKRISINKKGIITIKKGKYAKKTYNVKVKITVKGNSKFKSAKFIKIVEIQVK